MCKDHWRNSQYLKSRCLHHTGRQSDHSSPVRSWEKGKLVNWDSVRRKQMDYIYHCDDNQWSRWYMHPRTFSILPKIWSRHYSFTTIINYQQVYYVKSFIMCDEKFTAGSHIASWGSTILVCFQCCWDQKLSCSQSDIWDSSRELLHILSAEYRFETTVSWS